MNEIAKIKLEYGLSYKELSEETGIPKRSIEAWCQGRRTPPSYIPKLMICALENGLDNEEDGVENTDLIF